MSSLDWSDALVMHQPLMDATHHEFVDRLAALEAALDGPTPVLRHCYAELIEHTLEHFAQEERWMQALGFDKDNCHALQHASVLSVLREAQRWVARGDLSPLPLLVQELAAWFPLHAQTMDAALAQAMDERGLDTHTLTTARAGLPEAARVWSASEPGRSGRHA